MVIVFGSVNTDLLLRVERLPRAGETVHALTLDRQLGGKGANQAVAVVRAGARARLIAAVGTDSDGLKMRDTLEAYGVDVSDVSMVDCATGLAVVTSSSDDNQIIVVRGANDHTEVGSLERRPIVPGDICLTQLEVPLSLVRSFLEQARKAGAKTIFNPTPADPEARDLLPLADILVLNETELTLLSGQDAFGTDDTDAIRRAVAALRSSTSQAVIVTLGGNGIFVATEQTISRLNAHRVDVVDTTGAGDCFCGYLAAALAHGAELIDAAIEANAAAALSVQSVGAAASIPDRKSVLQLIKAERGHSMPGLQILL